VIEKLHTSNGFVEHGAVALRLFDSSDNIDIGSDIALVGIDELFRILLLEEPLLVQTELHVELVGLLGRLGTLFFRVLH